MTDFVEIKSYRLNAELVNSIGSWQHLSNYSFDSLSQ
ncbi:Uncharacterised protein [[Actinobacillus] rossii]|uniref:Uncharacterized protein n=1 Tax=[Actinobacillus] rossii TaxID=123820 RepID=A0A380TMB2_9PAST|nr:Uncharacterised protein [[Actinobacillus] rossii]